MDPFDEMVDAILGLPCWLVTKVHGSIVTMQFGQPRLTVGKPRVRSAFIEGVPELLQRWAHVEGDWSLTIYLCEWALTVDTIGLAHCESDAVTMARALAVLNGQELCSVGVAAADGTTEFTFDLGAVLQCRPAAPGLYGDEPSEMWWLSDDSVAVSVRDDATFSVHSTTTHRDNLQWLPLATRPAP